MIVSYILLKLSNVSKVDFNDCKISYFKTNESYPVNKNIKYLF